MSEKHELIGKKFNVLNAGHIILQDFMGSDEAILQAARTSYQKGITKRSDDRTLLRYLFRHQHSTPFEACVVKLHVKLPIFAERQWCRHRTAGWNEVSARYSELPEEYYIPDTAAVAAQSTGNKQGRGDSVDQEIAAEFQQDTEASAKQSFGLYRRRLDQGIARELSRIDLPLGTYTEKVWWMNLNNLIKFLALRMDLHAQLEIREYANVIGEQIVAQLFPNTWEAFQDYILNAMKLSALDISVIEDLNARVCDQTLNLPVDSSLFQSEPELRAILPAEWANRLEEGKICREFDEFLAKARRLNIVS